MRFLRPLLTGRTGQLFCLGALAACNSSPAPPYQVVKSYGYRIVLEVPRAQFQLRSPSRRLQHFRARRAPADAKMFAYYIQYHGGAYSIFVPVEREWLDTAEVAVPAACADSLFFLTQAFFHTLVLTNRDTLREGQAFGMQTDDSGGTLQVSWNGKTLMGQVDALHNDRTAPQNTAFLRVYRYFGHLFPPTAFQRPQN